MYRVQCIIDRSLSNRLSLKENLKKNIYWYEKWAIVIRGTFFVVYFL